MSWTPVLRALAAAAFLLLHTLLAALFILCAWGIERLIGYLWREHDPLLFGWVPLVYLFHAIDLAILGVFGFRGMVAANRAFRDEDD